MWGLCLGGWLRARAALAGASTGDAALAEEKFVTARLNAEQLLPACGGLLRPATAGADDLFALDGAAL